MTFYLFIFKDDMTVVCVLMFVLVLPAKRRQEKTTVGVYVGEGEGQREN